METLRRRGYALEPTCRRCLAQLLGLCWNRGCFTVMIVLHLFSFVAWTGGVAVVTYLACRNMVKSENAVDDHFIGGRSLPWYVVAGSLMLTNLSTEQLVGLNGVVFRDGCLAASAWEVFAAVAMCATATLFLPRYLSSGLTTTTGFLGHRFDQATRTLVSCVFLVFYAVGLCPSVLYTGALAIKHIFDLDQLPLWLVSLAIGLLGAAYALFGGLRAVAVSDCLNGVGLVVVGLWVPLAGLQKVGGMQAAFNSSEYLRPFVEKTDIYMCLNGGDCRRSLGVVSVPWHTNLTGMLLSNLYYWSTNQLIVQRALAARTLPDGQKGVLFAALMKIVGFMILCMPAVVSMLMVDRGALVVSRADEAYPNLVKEVMPEWSLGFFAAVLLGSVLSTFNSALNSSATLFTLEIYGIYVKRDMSPDHAVRVGTVFGVCCSLVSFVVAPFLSHIESIYDFIQRIKTLASLPIVTIFIVGLATVTPDAFAAKLAFVCGLAVYGAASLVSTPYWLHVYFVCFLICYGVLMLATYSPTLRTFFHQSSRPTLPSPSSAAFPPARARDIGSFAGVPLDMAPWPALRPMVVAVIFLVALLLVALQSGSLALFVIFWVLWTLILFVLFACRAEQGTSHENVGLKDAAVSTATELPAQVVGAGQAQPEEWAPATAADGRI